MNYPSDLAPLAPLRGEGLGERGFQRSSLQRNSQCFGALCPLIPSPSPPQSRGRREPAFRFPMATSKPAQSPGRKVHPQKTETRSYGNFLR
jgi:hypothetical protein